MTIFDDEMEKLERQQRELRNQYEEEEKEAWNGYEYARQMVAKTSLEYALQPKEKLGTYIIRLEQIVTDHSKDNVDKHVWNHGNGCWFTHKEKFGPCFMCRDARLYNYLFQLITFFANEFPDRTLDSLVSPQK